MKRIITVLALLLCLSTDMMAQDFQRYAGDWQGVLNVGVSLRIVFHVKENNGTFSSSGDSPDQSAYGLKCDTTIVTVNGIRIEMRSLNATFEGKLINDSTIDGKFTQGQTFPLLLKRSHVAIKPVELIRPQTPKQPFPYKSEDVEYDNADGSLHYGATITIPEGKGPFPAAVLITGSGPQDRDESLMGHKPFAVLADALTKNGFIVLRVDDRGVGKSTGTFNDATSADFVKDVSSSFDYLLSRTEVNKKKVGLIGHSEGGMIAPMVASQRRDVNFVVLLAAPGVKIDQLMAEQTAAVLRSMGIPHAAVDSYIPLYRQMMDIISTAPDSLTALHDASAAMQAWVNNTDSSLVKQMGFVSEQIRQDVVNTLVEGFSGKWFRYFLSFDPQQYLQKLNTKVLALNGEKDIQVIASSNLAGIEQALKKSKSKYTVKLMPGLNHLFQKCTTCSIQEYEQIEETVSPDALKEINDWLNKTVK